MAQENLSPEELALQESEAALAAEEKAREEAAKAGSKDLAEQHAEEEAAKAATETVTEAKPAEEGAAKPAPDDEDEAKAKAAEGKRSKEVDAIVALRKHSQMLAEQNAMLQGQVMALSKIATAKPNEAPKEPVKDRLVEIKGQQKALAKQVDAGEMTIEDYEDKRAVLEEEVFEIRLERKQPKQQQQQTAPTEDLYLAEQTAKLAQNYQFLNELTEEDMAPFYDLAIRQAAREGVRLVGASGTLELRKRMVELAAKVYQPEAKKEAAKPVADQSNDKSAALEAKLKLQERMPPDATKIGNGGDSTAMSESEVARRLFDPNTTTEQAEALLDSLPPALRDKLSAR